jgi:hypothetical protein
MTPETLQAENAELKRKLAEAEKACPCSGGGHTLTKCPYFRAEAAERERDALNELHNKARLASLTAERKCAELSEALRKYRVAMDALYNHNEAVRAAVVQHFGTLHPQAALASQPAPEGKPCPPMPLWKCEKHGARLCPSLECNPPAVPSDAKAGERPCRCGHDRAEHFKTGGRLDCRPDGDARNCPCDGFSPAAKPETKAGA